LHPQIIYPDRENIVGYDSSHRWELHPKKPKFKGTIVFLTSNGTMSAAETLMGIVEAYKLGTIIGQTTAGTNGNITNLYLPGSYSIVWTGMKVLKHDHTQHHLVGIHPNITVNRTLKGVKEGRDEVLERAIEYIKTGK
jgi:C-terminal processing protease CtpA/Prc